MSPPSVVEFQFIDYENPEQAKQRVKRRAVKSQAARYQWARDAAARASASESGSKRRGRGRGCNRAQVFNVLVRQDATTDTGTPPNKPTNGHSESTRTMMRVDCHPLDLLGAGRVDPFHTYPVEWRPYFPEIVDHYIVDMAVDISEIDGPNHRGLLRTRWFPLVMTEPATFLTILLLSASHLYSIQRKPNVAIDLLRLKEQAIRLINAGLADPSRSHSDAMVGAVAKMCSYEAMYGNTDSYMVHMNGLQGIISARGGLSELGLDGMLRRICLWIDLNSAFLNKTPRFFQGSFCEEPNPGQFIGSWDLESEGRDSVDRVMSD